MTSYCMRASTCARRSGALGHLATCFLSSQILCADDGRATQLFYHTTFVGPEGTVVRPNAETSAQTHRHRPSKRTHRPSPARSPHFAGERALVLRGTGGTQAQLPPPPPSATWSALLWPSAKRPKPYRGRPDSARLMALRGYAAATVAPLVPRAHAPAGDGRRSSTLAAARSAPGDDWRCIGEPTRGGVAADGGRGLCRCARVPSPPPPLSHDDAAGPQPSWAVLRMFGPVSKRWGKVRGSWGKAVPAFGFVPPRPAPDHADAQAALPPTGEPPPVGGHSRGLRPPRLPPSDQ